MWHWPILRARVRQIAGAWAGVWLYTCSAFNQEEASVGAFSVIVKTDGSCRALTYTCAGGRPGLRLQLQPPRPGPQLGQETRAAAAGGVRSPQQVTVTHSHIVFMTITTNRCLVIKLSTANLPMQLLLHRTIPGHSICCNLLQQALRTRSCVLRIFSYS